ncbi:MAG: ClpXP protease specificity-enhancing factor [Francisellaceae bacterium]|nr:ClpXP protease specificity-enhancing factor [Francisellaceae bacterium]
MTSTKPYLIRAFYEWILDNHCTPYLVVNVGFKGVIVPMSYVEGGQIVLNLAPHAVQALQMTNDAIQFQARFGGVAHFIYVPTFSVLAVYAKENGRGMVFAEEEEEELTTESLLENNVPDPKLKTQKKLTERPHLSIVKNNPEDH